LRYGYARVPENTPEGASEAMPYVIELEGDEVRIIDNED